VRFSVLWGASAPGFGAALRASAFDLSQSEIMAEWTEDANHPRARTAQRVNVGETEARTGWDESRNCWDRIAAASRVGGFTTAILKWRTR